MRVGGVRMGTSFVVEAVTGSGKGRLGSLSFGDNTGGGSIPTPSFLIHTTGGSVPHLTPDVLGRVFPSSGGGVKPGLLVSLDTCFTFQEALTSFKASGPGGGGGGIAKFAGLPDYPVFLTPHNPLRPLRSGFNHGSSIALWTRTGKRGIEGGDYAKAISSFNPTFVQALSDYDVGPQTGRKRLKKSASRTLEYLEGLTTKKASPQGGGGCGVFATLELGWFMGEEGEESEGKKAVEAILNDKKHLIQGWVISGGAFTSEVKEDKDKGSKGKEVAKGVESLDIVTIDKIIPLLPQDHPIYVPGPFSPSQMVELALRGVDLFDSSWVTGTADSGTVLNLDQIMTRFPSIQAKVKVNVNNEGLPHQGEVKVNINKEKEQGSSSPCIMTLKDKQYFGDFTPISTSCSCYTCRKHTRAYLNHLFATDELLGPVLVMIHNLSALTTLMETLRHLLKVEAESGGRSGKKDLEILQELLSSS